MIAKSWSNGVVKRSGQTRGAHDVDLAGDGHVVEGARDEDLAPSGQILVNKIVVVKYWSMSGQTCGQIVVWQEEAMQQTVRETKTWLQAKKKNRVVKVKSGQRQRGGQGVRETTTDEKVWPKGGQTVVRRVVKRVVKGVVKGVVEDTQ